MLRGGGEGVDSSQLVVQNSALVMVMHHSRNGPTGSQPRYLASTAVLLVEAIKLVASSIFATADIRQSNPTSSVSETLRLLHRSIFAPDCWKLILPAALYTLQNSLVYTAISNLDAVTFQVTYQLKILTTVLFSILLLGTSISSRQWFALVLLTFGVAMVQVAGPLGAEGWKDRLTALIQGDIFVEAPASSAIKGFMAVVAASLISGLTCVYFEKLVKDSLASVSLWTRNVQLSFFSLFPALFIGVLWQDGAAIARDGFFAGYKPIVWLTIALQAFGGLVVAVCIAYAGNVAKNFAASLSIVVSYAATAILFRTPLTMPATAGAAVVLLAMYLYHSRGLPRPVLLPMSNEGRSEKSKPLLFELMSPTR
ncbi:nucleotide-sugar transporter-domain-containing protein [Echria macrotheca]|uniref:Nucleotide-sugar transporter-domain-containing protein n=1 Tax=Echria macrotheca TaxID=438768 RepID=A0AAJ0BEB6_9PEZI|nr:nucleotide-sugar transporter-domain-containing protein [Echria macrotheca]